MRSQLQLGRTQRAVSEAVDEEFTVATLERRIPSPDPLAVFVKAIPVRRVLVVTKGLAIGGAERLIASSAPHWDRGRHEYHVAYLDPAHVDLVPDLTPFAATIEAGAGIGPAGIAAFRRVVHRIQPHLIHAHLPVPGVICRMMAPRTPLVYTEHSLAWSYRTPTRWANRLTYSRNTAVIAVSETVKTSLAGYPGPEPIVVPNGVPVPQSMPSRHTDRQALGLPEGPLLLHVGHVRAGKGHGLLIEAFELARRRNPGLALVSIGATQDESIRREINEYVAASDGAFKHLGFVRNPSPYYSAADVMVIPTEFEGLPISLLEGMAAGIPVVATNVGGVPDVIQDGLNGCLVPPGDAEALAARIVELISSSADRERLGAAAFKTVEQGFNIAENVRAVEQAYEGVVG